MRFSPMTASSACAVLLLAVSLPCGGAQPKKAPPEPLGASLCPAAVSVEQRVTTAPDGWEPSLSGAKPQLAMVTFFDGPPAERASLKYDHEEKRKGDWVGTWNLASSPRGYWIQCAYDNTTAVLSRRLPAEVTVCKVIYERKVHTAAGLPAVRHVSCTAGEASQDTSRGKASPEKRPK